MSVFSWILRGFELDFSNVIDRPIVLIDFVYHYFLLFIYYLKIYSFVIEIWNETNHFNLELDPYSQCYSSPDSWIWQRIISICFSLKKKEQFWVDLLFLFEMLSTLFFKKNYLLHLCHLKSLTLNWDTFLLYLQQKHLKIFNSVLIIFYFYSLLFLFIWFFFFLCL